MRKKRTFRRSPIAYCLLPIASTYPDLLSSQQQRLEMAMDYYLARQQRLYSRLEHRLQQQHPQLRLARQQTALFRLQQRLGDAMETRLRHATRQQDRLQQEESEEDRPPWDPTCEETVNTVLWQQIERELTFKQCEAVYLRNQGYKNREIAEMCGVRKKAIEKRFRRIRKKLKSKEF